MSSLPAEAVTRKELLHLNLTIEDSVYLSEPYRSTRVWERAEESVAFEPFACDLEVARRSSGNAVR